MTGGRRQRGRWCRNRWCSRESLFFGEEEHHVLLFSAFAHLRVTSLAGSLVRHLLRKLLGDGASGSGRLAL